MSDSERVIKREEIERRGVEVLRLGTDAEPASEMPPMTEPEETLPAVSHVEGDSEQVQRVRRLVQAMLSGFSRHRRELLDELQPHVARIAIEIAKRIVQRELRTDPGMVTRMVEAALEQVTAASTVRVRVHPLDAQTLEETLWEIVSAPDEAEALEIVPDGSIEAGGCVVESDRGIVDARLQTQFEEMQRSLLEAPGSHRSDEGGTR